MSDTKVKLLNLESKADIESDEYEQGIPWHLRDDSGRDYASVRLDTPKNRDHFPRHSRLVIKFLIGILKSRIGNQFDEDDSFLVMKELNSVGNKVNFKQSERRYFVGRKAKSKHTDQNNHNKRLFLDSVSISDSHPTEVILHYLCFFNPFIEQFDFASTLGELMILLQAKDDEHKALYFRHSDKSHHQSSRVPKNKANEQNEMSRQHPSVVPVLLRVSLKTRSKNIVNFIVIGRRTLYGATLVILFVLAAIFIRDVLGSANLNRTKQIHQSIYTHVPSVINKDSTEARQILEYAGLQVESLVNQSNNVSSQSIAPGSLYPKQRVIVLE